MSIPRVTLLCLAAVSTLLACQAEELPTAAPGASANFVSPPPSRLEPLNPFLLPRLPTYDHSMQAVHPDVVHFPGGWNGWEYWMAFTPFPGGDASHENPSIAVSQNGLNWQVPDGLTNPLVAAPSSGYNSDPDLSYDAERGELVLIYRTVAGGFNLVRERRSSDGAHWSAAVPLFRRRNHGMISPTLVLGSGGTARIWYVDAGSAGCQKRITRVMTQAATSPNTLRLARLERGWGPPRRVTLSQPGYNIWHLDVSWIKERSEYWAVYSAYPRTDCMHQELFFARSPDGITWQSFAIPFLRHGELPWTSETMYRAAMLYDADHQTIQFYTSSMSAPKTWHIGLVEYRLSTFLTALAYGVGSTPPTRMVFGPGNGDLEQ